MASKALLTSHVLSYPAKHIIVRVFSMLGRSAKTWQSGKSVAKEVLFLLKLRKGNKLINLLCSAEVLHPNQLLQTLDIQKRVKSKCWFLLKFKPSQILIP